MSADPLSRLGLEGTAESHMLSQFVKVLLGYDLFVSYSRRDAGPYARALVEQLEDLDFSCFIDVEELPVGQPLPPGLQRALRKSQALLLIGTEKGLTSRFVDQEVRFFLGLDRPVLPINVDHILEGSPWPVIRDATWIDESREDIQKARPSPLVLREIVRRFRLRRRRQIVRTSLVLVGLAFMALGLWAMVERQTALEQTRIATARYLTAAAQQKVGDDPELGVILALEAAGKATHADLDTRAAIERTMHEAVRLSRARHTYDISPKADGLNAVAINQERLIVASGADGVIHVLDLQSGRALDMFTFDAGRIVQLLLSGDASNLAVRHANGDVHLWSRTAKGMQSLPRPDCQASELAISNDGARAACAGNGRPILLWNVPNAEVLARIPGERTASLAFDPKGASLAVGDYSGRIRIYASDTGELAADLHSVDLERHNAAMTIVFSNDGGKIAVAHRDNIVRVWNLPERLLSQTLHGHHEHVRTMQFSRDSSQLLTGSADGFARVFDIATGHQRLKLAGHTAAVASVAFTPDSLYAVTSSTRGEVKRWYLGATEELAALATSHAAEMAFSANGRRLAVGSYEMAASVWDTGTWQRISTITGRGSQPVNTISITPDGNTVATDGEHTPVLWEAETGEIRNTLPTHDGLVTGIRFSPDGHLVASSDSEGTVRVWEAAGHKPVAALRMPNHFLHGVEFDPAGRLLAASTGATMRIWETKGWSSVHTLKDLRSSLSFRLGRNSDRVLEHGRQGLRPAIWNLKTGQRIHEFLGHTNQVNAVAFSPDELRVAASSRNGIVRVWDVTTEKELYSLPGYGDLSFSPDGRSLAIVQADGTVQVYAFGWDSLVALAKTRVTRPMTAKECRTYLVKGCSSP